MMQAILSFIALLWIGRIVVNILSWAHLWRVKEYRWDRMRIHLKTPQGKRIYFPPVRRPPLSPKTMAFVLGMVFLLGTTVFVSGFPDPVALFVFDAASFPLTFLVVGILNVPVRWYHAIIIRQAHMRLRSHAPMTVIGITGSFGKTSTKEYLSEILGKSMPVLKTPESKNSSIGIAEAVKRNLRDDHRVFVVEMGAYKKGEIAEMSRLVEPQIAVITAINEQHQDLFGSIEDTMNAKYELIEGLKDKRIAVCNADDPRVVSMGQRAIRDGVSVWWIGTGTTFPAGERMFRASGITEKHSTIAFLISDGKHSAKLQVGLNGRHQTTNVLAAIAAAVASGMRFADAVHNAQSIRPVSRVLDSHVVAGITLIDDTFNNNPDAAKAALDVLSRSAGRKFLVFQPMIELGPHAAEKHREVGAYAARICDRVYLTNRNWYEHFLDGVRSARNSVPLSVLQGQTAARHIAPQLKSGDTVLFKGKEAAPVYSEIKKLLERFHV